MTFIQLIETTTTRRDEMDALAERWRSSPKAGALPAAARPPATRKGPTPTS